MPGELLATNVEGDFASQFALTGLRFRNKTIAIDVDSASFAIDVDLVPLRVTFLAPEIHAVRLRLIDADNDRDQAQQQVNQLQQQATESRSQLEELTKEYLRLQAKAEGLGSPRSPSRPGWRDWRRR